MAAATRMLNTNSTGTIHLLSHRQILAERLLEVILCGCLVWDTESLKIKKVCDIAGG